jgi:methionyl-tRNA synthetase
MTDQQNDMAEKPRYYLTTAIAYPNGVPHVGHAYEAIATDAIARFMRLDGHEVYFLTGTDEHGIKMLQTATREGITPRQLVERNVPRFQAMVERLNISNDDFIRTTEKRHHESSQAIWDRMQKNGDIYLSKYSGWYSVRDEAYYDEDETTVDPKGQRLGPQNTPVEWVEEESYFFKLSAYQDKLLNLYTRVPDFVLPKERLNEVASFVKRGLRDLSISRTTFEWGIPVPAEPGTNAKHIMYVWVDALTNYITALGFPNANAEKFLRYWPADLHVIGKDIVRFHAIYWPAFLMSAGIAVPRRIFSHGFLFNRGEKMSKSVGNVVDPFALVDAYGVDQLRYFLLREVPFGQDGNYSHEAIVNRINADLANDLGNLAQRSLSMIGKQFGGVLPKPGAFSENDKTILNAADAMIGKAREAMKTQPPGRWSPMPTAISRARRRGRSPRPIRRSRARCSMSRQRSSGRWRSSPSPSFRHRRASCLISWPCPRANGASQRSAAIIGSRPARRCRRRQAYSRAMSTPKPTISRATNRAKSRDHAGRQPLPSRLPGLRRRSRRHCRPCQGRRRRAHGDNLHEGEEAGRSPCDHGKIPRRLLFSGNPST